MLSDLLFDFLPRKADEINALLEPIEWTNDLIKKLQREALTSSMYQTCQENFVSM